ncbi:MAG: hypothetical protein KC589_11095 [Nanoarchaeota archaeon]|nr:hypothetical protein [Nanoarchaeota archaeon]
MKKNKYWFKPKSYGYGATPISWEGWVLTIAFILAIFILVKYTLYHPYLFYSWLILLIMILILIAKNKTEEKWAWRWGRK